MEDLDRRLLLGAAGLAGVAAFAGRGRAGPLDPPAGPVTSTGKQLAEIEPRTPLSAASTPGDASSVFRIVAPGSYYLTANVAPPAGKNAIKIAASDVTIDLNGFTIAGVAGSLSGVAAESAAFERIVVRNGHMANMANGVSLWSNTRVRAEDLMIDGSVTDGVAFGVHGAACRCRVSRSGRHGFYYGAGATFIDCAARNNGASSAGDGFRANGSSTACFNDCLAESSTQNGFRTFGAVTMENCAAYDNGANGMLFEQGEIVVRGCISQGNQGDGFNAGGGLLEGCVAASNWGAGIRGGSSVVRGCRIISNGVVGIAHASFALIQGNSVSRNGAGTGIEGSGNGSRISDNFVSGGSLGIVITGGGNLITGNMLSGVSTPFTLSVNNFYGSIISRYAASTPAVIGGSASTVLTTADPFANIVC